MIIARHVSGLKENDVIFPFPFPFSFLLLFFFCLFDFLSVFRFLADLSKYYTEIHRGFILIKIYFSGPDQQYFKLPSIQPE